MKKNFYFMSFLLSAGLLASCSNDQNSAEDILPDNQQEQTILTPTRAFPEDDGAEKLISMPPAARLYALLEGADSSFYTSPANYEIASFQYEEIKEFTDELCADRPTDNHKYRAIYDWVRKNVQYEHSSNEPYDVFYTKTGICQGYANLMNVMLLSQGIPVINANGFMVTESSAFGHAWNYVRRGGKWYLSDATNSIEHLASDLNEYQNTFIPRSADGNFLENEEFAFNYNYEHLNLNEVKSCATDALVVPFSVTLNNGKKYQITSFNPTAELPSNIREIYIGANITSIGQENNFGLKLHAPNVEAAYVDEANSELKSHAGVVYSAWAEVPLYIPSAMKKVYLLPTKMMDKEHIANHEGIEEIYVAEGTESIGDWAVENCPNLKVAYVPMNIEISENAFTRVHEDFQIVRQDMTGIKDVIAD